MNRRPSRSAGRPGDGLDLEVLLEAGDAVLPADAAGLVSAEGDVGAVGGAPLTPMMPARIRRATASDRSSEPTITLPARP